MTAVAGDAARLGAYEEAAPADLVLLCGVFGNIPDDDVRRTMAALPMLCSAGATVIWTRHRRVPDLTDDISRWFDDNGFTAVDFTSPGPGRFGAGTHRFDGDPRPLRTDSPPLFTFVR